MVHVNTIMKGNLRKCNLCVIVVMLIISIMSAGAGDAVAQINLRGGVQVSESSRTVVVEPDDYPNEAGKLNRIIKEEIAVDPETIFILKRDAVYWLDATIVNEDFTLHIIAEEGEGHPPIIRPTNLKGSSSHLFYTGNHAIFEGVFLNAIDEDGVATRPLVLQGKGNTLIFNKGWVVGTHDWSIAFMDAGNSLFVTNSVFANAGRVDNADQGRFLETRGYDQDTIWVENTTMYNFKHAFLRNSGALVGYLHLNHITGVNVTNNIRPNRTIDATITNNLFLNFYADGVTENSTRGIIAGTAIGLAPVTDADRTFNISHNNIGFMDEEHREALSYLRWQFYEAPVLDETTASWAPDNSFTPKLIFEDNIKEGVEFTDPPDPITPWTLGKFGIEREMVYDNWESAIETTDPAPYHYTLSLIRDFSYSTSHASYSAAENGFPAGDLNWFPELKELWEQGKPAPTTVGYDDASVRKFRLLGNYPNPFNPTTNIVYEIPFDSEVRLALYNILGQNVRTLDIGMQPSGRHEVSLDVGHLPSGIYMVRMQLGSEVHTLRISLVK
jgi:hypothetical protein